MMMSLLMPLIAQASAAQTISTPPELDCSDPMTQTAMNMCSFAEYQRADAALNAQWTITARAMRENDTYIDRTYDTRPGYFETLLTAQRAWLNFRDAHCANEGYMARGGSMEPLLVNTCMTALTQERTQQLQERAEGLEG